MLFLRLLVRQFSLAFASIFAAALFFSPLSLAQSQSESSSQASTASDDTKSQPEKTSTVSDTPDSKANSSGRIDKDPKVSSHRLPPSLERQFATNFIQDQRAIWSSPLRLKRKDAFWLIPAAALTGELLHRDAYLYQKLTPNVNPGTTSKSFSDYAVVGMAGGIAGMYFLGRLHGDEHARETGVLAAEAAVDSLALSTFLKYTLRRERPFNGTGRGDFFVSGGDSFPSTHAITAWSLATVVANEYPGVLTKIGAYGLASGISIARITGRQHFPTDVVVGSALGYGIGKYVYSKHHNPELPGEDIGTITRSKAEEQVFGSPYVPLESWIYPALDRLSSLGYVRSGFSGIRPWTRIECARLVTEAENVAAETVDDNVGVQRLIAELKSDLQDDREGQLGSSFLAPRLESIYTRVTGISGPPLTDGYHFGQTIYNDYGRPFREGVNLITGFSGWAAYGRWTVYGRGEYQHSPSAPALSLSTSEEISRIDSIPVQPGMPFQDLNRFRILDAYVSYNFAEGWAVAAGKQSLWWGPADTGSLIFSDNAEPIEMVRLTRVSPLALPGFLHYLGAARGEFFVGQLAGHQYLRSVTESFGPPLARQPLIDGGKVSFKPTPNFEFGVSVTTVFGGPGFPLTARSFLRTVVLTNTNPGEPNDPGDRRSGFDFRYRIPKLRNKLTIYNDSMTEDEISPIGYPRRSAMAPGIYLPSVPGIPRLDFRAEGFYTDLPGLRPVGSYYYNARFLSGYTSQGNLLGNVVGRQGSGFALKSTYWFSARKSIELGHRRNQVSPEFIERGGSLRDYWTKVNWKFGHIDILGKVQYERWNFPSVAPTQRSNFASTLQITYQPSRSGSARVKK